VSLSIFSADLPATLLLARRAGPRQKKDIQLIQSKIRRFGIKQQKLHRERVSYLVMDVPQDYNGRQPDSGNTTVRDETGGLRKRGLWRRLNGHGKRKRRNGQAGT